LISTAKTVHSVSTSSVSHKNLFSSAGYIVNKRAAWEAATICPDPCKLTFDLLTLKVVSESRDVGYLCANFSLPRPLCSRLSPDVHDRQTDEHHHL